MDREYWLNLLKTGQVLEVLEGQSQFENESYRKEVIEKAVRMAAQECPEIALQFYDLYEHEPYAAAVLEKAVRTAAEINPDAVLSKHELYKDTTYAQEVLERAARNAVEKDPKAILWYGNTIKNQSYGNELLKKAALIIAEKDPIVALDFNLIYKDAPFANEVIERAAKNAVEKYPSIVDYYYPLYQNQPYADELLEKAVRHSIDLNPYGLFSTLEPYLNKPYAKEVLFAAAEKVPLEALFSTDAYIDKPYAKELLTKSASIAFKDNGNILKILERMNSQHDLAVNIRFALLPFLTQSQKYDLITKGRDDAYTSTYLGIADSLLRDLQKSHQPMDAFLSTEQVQKIGVFLEAAASYNRIDQMLATLSDKNLPSILHNIVVQCADRDKGMSDVVTLGTIITASPVNKTLRQAFEKELFAGYDRAIMNKATRHRYGLLAALYAHTYENTIVTDEKISDFFKKMRSTALYQIPPINTLDQSRLTDIHGHCNELMVFASDNDGKESYNHWKQQYSNQPGWQVLDFDHYTLIQKKDGKVPVFIYANKPEAGMNAVKEIKQVAGSFQIFIGRGHSYYLNDYLKYLDDGTGLAILGSCGGYNHLSSVLKIDPKAQIIATRETGSMYVNEPLAFNLNQAINQSGQIDWQQQEKKLQQISSAYKDGYLLPNKNIGLEILQYYNEIKDAPTITFDTSPVIYTNPSSLRNNLPKVVPRH